MKNSTLMALVVSITVFSGGLEAMAQKKQYHQGKGQGMQMMQSSCPMRGMQMNGSQKHTFSKGRIAFLKAELEITDAQRPLFEAYAESVKANLSHMQNMREKMQGMMQVMKQAETPLERLNLRVNMMESRLGTLKAMQEPLEALFEVLSDEQKEKANQLMPGMTCMQ